LRVSKKFYFVFSGLALGLFVWIIFNDLIFLGLSAALILFLLANFLIAIFSIRGIDFYRRSSIHNHFAFSIFEETFSIINNSRTKKFWVEINDLSKLGTRISSRVATNLKPHKEYRFKQSMLLLKRGKYSLGPTEIISGDLFGIFINKKIFTAEDELTVYPNVFLINHLWGNPAQRIGGEFIEAISTASTTQAAGIREYAPGDPLNRVHWPYSLKHRRLIVKEFDDDKQANLWILLDIEEGRHFLNKSDPVSKSYKYYSRKSATEEFKSIPDSFDYAVSIAASLANFVIKKRFAAGLITQDEKGVFLKPEKGDEHLYQILEELATISPSKNLSLCEAIGDLLMDIPEGSSIVIITACQQDELDEICEAAILKNLHLTVIYINSKSFDMSIGKKENVQVSAKMAPLIHINFGDNLQEKFE